MARLSTELEDSLSGSTLKLLENFRVKGKLASVYLQIANSEHALQAYLGLENALKESTLSVQEIEAIKLLASEINACEHCLSVHHFKAGVAGFSEEQRLAIRQRRKTGIDRVDAIVAVVAGFFAAPGALSDEQLASLRESGFSDAELVDISLATSTIFFTNIFNHLNNTRSPLPAAPDASQVASTL